jgi:hypothetical protein
MAWLINPLKASWLLYAPPGFNTKNTVLCAKWFYVLRIILSVTVSLHNIRRLLFSNGRNQWRLCGTNWISKYSRPTLMWACKGQGRKHFAQQLTAHTFLRYPKGISQKNNGLCDIWLFLTFAKWCDRKTSSHIPIVKRDMTFQQHSSVTRCTARGTP